MVRLNTGNSTVVARCREISEDGMVLEALKNPLADFGGMVAVSHKGITMELEARVARSESECCGLEFVYKSEAERKMMAHFIASVREAGNRPGPRLLV
jgi:hypothetical protein